MEYLQKSGSDMRALLKVSEIRKLLESSGVQDASREAELIVSFCLERDRVFLYRDDPEVSAEAEKKIDLIVSRRIEREPLQYIMGFTEFCGLRIKTVPGVLIPRPETELLVEEVVKTVASFMTQDAGKGGKHPLSILDLCTGTGCIAIALAGKFPDSIIYATDISAEAIKCARENALINSAGNTVFLQGNLFEPLKNPVEFDMIVSNPPYIRKSEIKGLQPEVSKWEPVEALDGGDDGLDYYRAILKEVKAYLKKDGFIIFEAGAGQAEDISGIAAGNGYGIYSIKKDFAGIERVVTVRKK